MAKKSKERGKLGHNSDYNANYDYKQSAPRKPMGHGSFANLPDQPMFRSFSGKCDYRSGIPNNPVMSVDMLSEVDENMRDQYGHDSA